MSTTRFDRDKLRIRPLCERRNRLQFDQIKVPCTAVPRDLPAECREIVAETAEKIRAARRAGKAVICSFGAHAIKNGLGPVLIGMMERGWMTHLATNGAGIIHDWEFAFQGASGEDVKAYVREGQFGIWEETGYCINLALAVGAYRGLGYGESVGAMIEQDGLDIPSRDELTRCLAMGTEDPETAAAAADLLGLAQRYTLEPGRQAIPHPFKAGSVAAAAFRGGIPFTGHPMIGHDIIYCHPMNHGGVVGRTALRDFLLFANSVAELDQGVYLSLGSAIMSPMIFEKAFSMVQNIETQQGRHMDGHHMVVVDLAPVEWNWQRQGEPPPDHPAYYVRFCKSFSRMGGTMRYAAADNRDFLLALYHALAEGQSSEPSSED